MAQHIKVRDPTDMLKIQARVKNDLEGMHHANQFFRQRYSNQVKTELSTMRPSSRAQTASQTQCYRPRPFVDSRTNCLANYDEYLAIREVDKVKKQSWNQQLLDQIQSRRQSTVTPASRQSRRNES